MTTPATYLEPELPTAAGPLSGAVIAHLKCRAPRRSFIPVDAPVGDSSPWGRDLQLALYVCYELHYRGFADVEPRWEWDPGVLHLRARLEDAFLSQLQQEIGVLRPDRVRKGLRQGHVARLGGLDLGEDRLGVGDERCAGRGGTDAAAITDHERGSSLLSEECLQ